MLYGYQRFAFARPRMLVVVLVVVVVVEMCNVCCFGMQLGSLLCSEYWTAVVDSE